MTNLNNETLRVLYVEDDEDAFKACIDSATVYCEQNGSSSIVVEGASSVEEAKMAIRDKRYDAVILDLKLDSGKNEDGEAVLSFIKDNHRIPIAIYSGTPSAAISQKGVQCFTRGEAKYADIFDHFFERLSDPLYSVVGQNGTLDKMIGQIFWERLFGESMLNNVMESPSHISESLIMRQIVVHLQDLTTQSDTMQNPVDMFFCPFDGDRINTGTILRKKKPDIKGVEFGIVLSPPCDLVRRGGEIRTPCIAVCSILELGFFYSECIVHSGSRTKSAEITGNIKKLVGNTFSDYAHWVWPIGDMSGGVIDFRDVSSFDEDALREIYSIFPYAIQESYMKNILRRFASFYNRQGQPDIDSKDIIKDLKNRVSVALGKGSKE